MSGDGNDTSRQTGSEPSRPAAGSRAPEVPVGEADVLDSLAEVVFSTDPAGNWTYLNPAWTALTGYSVGEALGTNFLDYVHPDERERTIALFMAVVAGGGRYCHHRTRYRKADGGYRWIDLRATLLRDGEGNPVANVGTIVDVTDRFSAQETISEQAQVLEVVAEGSGFDELPLGIATFTKDLTLVRGSPVVERMLGVVMQPGDDLSRVLRRLETEGLDDGRLTGEWGMIGTALRTGRPQYAGLTLSRPDQARHVSLQVTVIPLAARGHADFALVLHDVSNLRRAERQQAGLATLGQRSLEGPSLEDLYEAAVEAVTDVLDTALAEIFELSPERDLLVPRAAAGWPGGARDVPAVRISNAESPIAQAFRRLEPVIVADLPDEARLAEPWLADKGAVSSGTVVIRGRDHPFGVLSMQTLLRRPLTEEELTFLQGVANVLATAVERTRAEEATRQQTLHDPLTGLANRVLLHDHLTLALSAAARSGCRVGLLLMDLDRFKEINDTLGHSIGDEVLRIIGARVRHCVRESDTVARLGGDEFALVMPVVADVNDAVALATKLNTVIQDLIEVNGISLRTAASIGIAIAPEDGDDARQLLTRADAAMYRAKSLATGFAVYSAGSDQNRPERLAYLSALRRGLAEEQLVIHYQPKIDLTTRRPVGAEALVRWHHPTEGLVAPAAFLDLAEQTGLIKPLTWRVIDDALRQVRRWRECGVDLPVSVNVSARMLHYSDLVGHIVDALQQHRLPASSLVVEVTETAMMANASSGVDAVSRLDQAGVRVSLDNFGTGQSTLAYLRDLPVHELKIDRSFVRNVTTSGRDAAIVRAIVDLGHLLSLRVVAEGIETAQAYELLKSLGCDEGQGFHLGRPGPADAVLQALTPVETKRRARQGSNLRPSD